jgi:hypothetical protein
LSQDDFWKQWAGAQADAAKDEAASPASGPGRKQPDESPEQTPAKNADEDVLSAWLAALPDLPPEPAPGPAKSEASPPGTDPFLDLGQRERQPSDTASWDDILTAPPGARGPDAPSPAPAGPPAVPTPAGSPAPPAADEDEFLLDLDPAFANQPAAASPPAEAPVAPRSPFGPPLPPAGPPAEALQAMPIKLAVTVGRRTQELAIRGEALIGRPDLTRGIRPEVDLRLDDAVSRRHAKIYLMEGQYVLADLNSTNGTRHNGQWLAPEAPTALQTGDEIELGEQTLIRVLEAPKHA